MKIVKDVLICILLSAVSALFFFLVVLVRDADKTVKAVPAEITAINYALTAEIESTRRELLATVNTQATAIQKTADHRLASIQQMVDARTAQALQMADARLGQVTAQTAPVLANAAALTKDAQNSLDDNYYDLKALVESATVATTQVAQTAESVRQAAPQVAASVEGISKSADSVAADVKKEADSLVAPKKWWQKALGPVYTVARIVAAFL